MTEHWPAGEPFDRFEGTVKPEWIDPNGHMNLAYYVVLFDNAVTALCEACDLDWDYTGRTNNGVFAAETHTRYERELLLGERVRVHTWVLGVDAKRMHLALEMLRLPDLRRAATMEMMYLHVDLGTRRVAPWPTDQRGRIEALATAHAGCVPDWVGRRVMPLQDLAPRGFGAI